MHLRANVPSPNVPFHTTHANENGNRRCASLCVLQAVAAVDSWHTTINTVIELHVTIGSTVVLTVVFCTMCTCGVDD